MTRDPSQVSIMAKKFPQVQPGGSLILAWQIKGKKVLVVGGGEVSETRAAAGQRISWILTLRSGLGRCWKDPQLPQCRRRCHRRGALDGSQRRSSLQNS